MKQYGNYRESSNRVDCTILEDFMSKEEVIEYDKMIDLLYKYNELVKTLNIGIVGENAVLNDIEILRNQREGLILKESQFIGYLKRKEKTIKEGLKEIQTKISVIDIHNLEEMSHLSTTMFQLKEQAEKVTNEKKILENLRFEENEMLQKHEAFFASFTLYENRLYDTQRKIEELVQEIECQALFLENLEIQNEKKGMRKKEENLREMFNSILKPTIRIFHGISSEIRGDIIKSYLDILYSYSELRYSILRQALPIAQNTIENYKIRPTKLERNNNIDLFSYNIEIQLQIVIDSIYQIARLPLEKQKLEAQRIIYNMKLIMNQNMLYIHVICGENVEENLEKLYKLGSKEAECKNITQLYKEVNRKQNFSIYTLGSKKINNSKTDSGQKLHIKM